MQVMQYSHKIRLPPLPRNVRAFSKSGTMHVFLAILAFASFFEGQLSAVNAQVCIPHIFYEVLKPDNLYGVKSFPGGDLNACNCVGTHDTGEAGKNYVCRDPLLGPKILPKNPHLTSFVSYYNRFGGDAPGEFLKRWTINGSYIYPPQNGFQLDLTGKPILGNMTLLVGTMVDRFGSEYGRSPIDQTIIFRIYETSA